MDPMIPTVAADLKHYQDNDEWDLVRPVPLRFGTHDWRGQAYMDHLEIVIQLQRRGKMRDERPEMIKGKWLFHQAVGPFWPL